jgi:hypothetical protein
MFVEVTDEILIDPLEVASIEAHHDHSPSGGYISREINGSVVVLKNGRKIYISKLTPQQVKEKLNVQVL